ncbi:MAG: hypothetical protein V7709_10520 [Halioglobus sp.]
MSMTIFTYTLFCMMILLSLYIASFAAAKPPVQDAEQLATESVSNPQAGPCPD